MPSRTIPTQSPLSRVESVPTAPASRRFAPLIIAAAALLVGSYAAVHYSQLGLSLSHYDARAHLVVARRILDSLSPGWQQIGAVWLPLPHVLNMIPVQVDAWYRSGASAIAISVLSTSVASWALARLILAHTGSISAAVAGAALMMINPNLLYLQSTPMTEPLLAATCMIALLVTADWVARDAPLPPRAPGWAIVAACMTRYEAWPICGTLIALAGIALVRRGVSVRDALRACLRVGMYPLVAGILFTLNSRWTTGSWFVPSTFYVPENDALGSAWLALDQVRESVYALSGSSSVWPAYAGAALATIAFLRSRDRAPLILVLALVASATVPWYAYYHGHPLRVRYGVPLVVAAAAITAGGIGLLRGVFRPIAAAAVIAWALSSGGPLDHTAVLVKESQRDAQNRRGREVVTDYLRQHWDGSTIMMSMGSLAHYMHDLSALGFDLRDFLHEGNEQLWVYAATLGPRGYVTWVVVEEHAEGGDVLYQAQRSNPRFFEGFERVAEGGGVSLYRVASR